MSIECADDRPGDTRRRGDRGVRGGAVGVLGNGPITIRLFLKYYLSQVSSSWWGGVEHPPAPLEKYPYRTYCKRYDNQSVFLAGFFTPPARLAAHSQRAAVKGHLRTLSRANKRVCFACASAMCLARRARTWSSSGAVDGLSLSLASLLLYTVLYHSGCRHAWKPQPTSLGVLAYAVKSRCMNQRLRLRRASGKS